jgi:uncharacterized protein (TIGR00730 family)
MEIKRVAIFCGSSTGGNPDYKTAAKALAHAMARMNIDMVYGGGSVGLMGIIADEMMTLGRRVYGIIPKKIYDWEVGHEQITQLEVVKDMHERKAKMAEMSDSFIAMPGGIGTLEEIVEAFTWLQLDYHQKPCAFYNINGYYDHLIRFFDHMVSEGFLQESQNEQLIVSNEPNELLQLMVTNNT